MIELQRDFPFCHAGTDDCENVRKCLLRNALRADDQAFFLPVFDHAQGINTCVEAFARIQ